MYIDLQVERFGFLLKCVEVNVVEDCGEGSQPRLPQPPPGAPNDEQNKQPTYCPGADERLCKVNVRYVRTYVRVRVNGPTNDS